MLLREAFAQCKSLAVATVHCNARTTSEDVIQKLNLACSVSSSNTGRVYRPTAADRLVLWLRDLNLPKPDKYDTVELIAFLQQLLTHLGLRGRATRGVEQSAGLEYGLSAIGAYECHTRVKVSCERGDVCE